MSIERVVIFFRLDTDPVVRLWSGKGDYEIPADSVEGATATYRGLDALVNLPALAALINGQASRIEFGLSGVDTRVLELADAEADDVRGKTVRIGLAREDANWQRVGSVQWLWTGIADVLVTDRDTDPEGKVSRSVTLSVGSLFTGRRRPSLSYFTNAHQTRRSADDRFCERTPLHTNTLVLTWPRF